jgi:hypothetical protein
MVLATFDAAMIVSAANWVCALSSARDCAMMGTGSDSLC